MLASIVGRTWPRLLANASLGIALWVGWSLYSAGAECPPDRECTPGLGAFLGAFTLLGWLAGVGAAVLSRRFRPLQSRPEREAEREA